MGSSTWQTSQTLLLVDKTTSCRSQPLGQHLRTARGKSSVSHQNSLPSSEVRTQREDTLTTLALRLQCLRMPSSQNFVRILLRRGSVATGMSISQPTFMAFSLGAAKAAASKISTCWPLLVKVTPMRKVPFPPTLKSRMLSEFIHRLTLHPCATRTFNTSSSPTPGQLDFFWLLCMRNPVVFQQQAPNDPGKSSWPMGCVRKPVGSSSTTPNIMGWSS
mmetsp:Transcript_29576/g.68840  ORF Transcript_29576/g.68840 Transcript_29576/m.68840 type:complete len:218 (-) Transcript_29576:785-1438(-)